MPGFDFLDRVEQYVRTGTFPPEVDTKAARHVIKRASKQFIYKGMCGTGNKTKLPLSLGL